LREKVSETAFETLRLKREINAVAFDFRLMSSGTVTPSIYSPGLGSVKIESEVSGILENGIKGSTCYPVE
jgi:hypothetical protein